MTRPVSSGRRPINPCIMEEQRVSARHNPMKNRFTLMLCSNTSGDLN